MPSSLTRFLPRALVSLYPPTCVGFGTACIRYRDAFLGSRDAWTRPGRTQGSARTFPSGQGGFRHPHPLSFSYIALEPYRRCGNVGPLSIGYAFRPGLRCRLTPGGRTCPGKPWDSGDRNFHPVFRYSCPHNRWRTVHRRLRARLLPGSPRSPTVAPRGRGPRIRCGVYSRSFSAQGLSSSQLLRTVQMMAASKPTSCLSERLHGLSD